MHLARANCELAQLMIGADPVGAGERARRCLKLRRDELSVSEWMISEARAIVLATRIAAGDRSATPALKEALSSASADWIGDADLIVISDYDKGVCGNGLIAHIVELARFAGVRVVADPASGVDYRRYARCTCITPNRTEAGRASATTISSTGEALQVAQRLLGLDVESVALTLDRDGIAWADSAGNSRLFPARARSVADITGAGDMVISAIAYSLAAGADYTTAVELANYAAGLEVERLGVVPLARQELLAGLSSTPSRPAPRPPFEVRSTRQETIDVACG